MAVEKFVSMLFSDLKGFSKIKNDDLKTKLEMFLKTEILDQLLNPTNHIYANTWGDAFYICSEHPVALAEFALQMRDKIRHKDWIRFGLSEDLEVRIALHAQTAQVIVKTDGTISNVVGKGVDTTARIEPVTQPNDVFCSETFHQLLINESPRNISGIAIGRTKLAKNFGEMNLFRLIWASEASQQTSPPTVRPTTPMPRIKSKPTDRERNDFLYEAFSTIRSYLQSALDQLSSSNPNVEFSLRDITNTKLICEIYLNGQHKNSCKIWVGGHLLGSNAINYSEGRINTDSDSAINEILQLEDDGSELYFKSLMSITSQSPEKMLPEQAAEHLWIRFTKPLEH